MDRKYSLKENHMFSKVIRRGRSSASSTVAVYALRNYNRGAQVRIGVSAGVKLGGAVERNRAKRVIREGVRAVCARLQRGYLLVIVARAPCFDRSVKSGRVAADIERICRGMGLLS